MRGSAKGHLSVRTDPAGESIAEMEIKPEEDWTAFTTALKLREGTHPLFLCYEGKGRIDILDFSFARQHGLK